MKKENISELSVVIQGEGRDLGQPALLIRMIGCNLTCQFKDGICDSANTSWIKSPGKFSMKEVEEFIKKNDKIKYTFITGGNPSFQPKLLKKLVLLLKKYGHYVAIEDNGTLFVNLPEIDFVTLSPKLSNSIPRPGSIVNDEVFGIHKMITEKEQKNHSKYLSNYTSMKNWINSHDYQLKFVVSEKEQLKEIEELCEKIGAEKRRIYLMPEGATREQLSRRRKEVYELALKYGYHYTDRLHILVYDNKTGV